MDIFNIPKRNLNNIIQKINICEDKIIRTRNQIIRSTSSCRIWQLKYCIITYFYNLFDLKIFEDPKIITEICNIIHKFIETSNIENSILHQIIIYNRPINLTQINSFDDLLILKDYSPRQAFYMCIFNQNIDLGSIIHFFTIIRINDDYYLNSSYGSDHVCVPQYTTILNIKEFNEFCNYLLEKNPNLSNFYEKYFLRENLRKRFNNNTIEDIDPSLKSAWINPKEGIEKELKVLFYPESSYCIGLINNYNELMSTFIKSNSVPLQTLAGGYKRKKTKKKKN